MLKPVYHGIRDAGTEGVGAQLESLVSDRTRVKNRSKRSTGGAGSVIKGPVYQTKQRKNGWET